MYRKRNMLKIVLAIICGLLVGVIITTINYDWGIAIASGLAGGMICSLVKERTSATGFGKVFGFISAIIGFILYRMIIILFLQFSIPILLIVYFAPYVIVAYALIEIEVQENKGEAQHGIVTEHRTVMVYPNTNEVDPFFIDAGRLIIEYNKVSIGMLQRVYKIDFNRASNIMDQLCNAGVVGNENGPNSRKVLMSIQEFEYYLKANGYL